MKFVNLRNRDVVIEKESGRLRLIAQEHNYFSLEKKRESLNEMDGVPVTAVTYKTFGSLPKPQKGTVYIVPRIVASRNPSRRDLFIPDGVVNRSEDQLVCKSISLY